MLTRPAAALLVALLAGCQSTPYREVAIDLEATPTSADDTQGQRTAHVLRFAIAAMESPRDTYTGYTRMLDRLGHEVGGDVELVQRRTYREVNDMLTAGQLDVALVCIGGYLDLRRRAPSAFELIAVPVIDGETTYQSLVIVPAASPAARVEDLAGKRFAFTDELSFSGHTYLVEALEQKGLTPDRLFAGTLYTHSHDRSVDAIAAGIADGAVVSSVIFRHQLERRPGLADKIRVIDRSPSFGMMPIVASTRLSAAERARLRRVLFGLHLDPEAAAAMRLLHIDRFEEPSPGLYDSAAAIVERGR
jgi:phosphonate transport system substrate-binding protein